MSLAPALLLDTHLPEWDVRAWLVVDRHVRGVAWGGLRILPDPCLEELRASARVMTRKYGFVGFASGGAKAALEFPAALEPERPALLRELGRRWAEVLREGAWNPAIDMGCRPGDLTALREGAGLPPLPRAYTLRSGDYTAWTVFASAAEAFRARGGTLRGRTAAIEGFGSVGSELARLLHESGNRVVAVSNREGARFDPRGFDVPELLRRRAALGDGWLTGFEPGAALDAAELPRLDVDLFAPCARADSIRADSAPAVRARVVACGANAAMSQEVEASLARAGTRVVPDFVANCGGILGSTLEPFLGEPGLRALVRGRFARVVRRLFREADRTGETLGELAGREGLARLAALERSGRGPAFGLGRAMLAALPAALRRPLARAYCERWLFGGGGGGAANAARR